MRVTFSPPSPSPAGRREPSPHRVSTGQGPPRVTQQDSCTPYPMGLGPPQPSFLARETEAQGSGRKCGSPVVTVWPGLLDPEVRRAVPAHLQGL